MDRCRICGNADQNETYVVREMLLGLREEFRYFKCHSCGCLQIAEIPADMSRYYPAAYHSHNVGAKNKRKVGYWRGKLKNFWKMSYLNGGIKGKFVTAVLGKPGVPQWIERTGVGTSDAVLDIGCGDGSRLMRMWDMGFRNLTGIDPYKDNSPASKKALSFICGELSELAVTNAKYDFIMLHHSLEHMPDQDAILKQVCELLNDEGAVLIRIPLVSSYAWAEYGTDWFALDAPRHFYLHTEQSLERLAGACGLSIIDSWYDSDAQSLWASEQYRRDITFMDPRSVQTRADQSVFSPDELRTFSKRARKLNERREGDQACFILRKCTAPGSSAQ